MKLLETLNITLFAALIIAISYGSSADDIAGSKTQEEASAIAGVRRFLAQQNLGGSNINMNCDKFPRACRLMRSSPGPDCCKKKCVNVKSDRMNCGMCGYKCKYSEICCKGQCVNASFDRRNCGGCNKKCKKGEYCVYGMCDYA